MWSTRFSSTQDEKCLTELTSNLKCAAWSLHWRHRNYLHKRYDVLIGGLRQVRPWMFTRELVKVNMGCFENLSRQRPWYLNGYHVAEHESWVTSWSFKSHKRRTLSLLADVESGSVMRLSAVKVQRWHTQYITLATRYGLDKKNYSFLIT